MIKEKNFSFKRVRRLLLMTAGTIIFTILLAFRFQFWMDIAIALTLLQLMFFPVFLAFLESERIGGRLNGNQADSYRILCPSFLCVLLLYFIFTFFPAYLAPVLIPAVWITAVSNPAVGAVVSVYLNLFLCMMSECSYYELAYYILFSLVGVLAASWLEKKKNRVSLSFILFATSLVFPELFYYLATFQRNPTLMKGGAVCGAAAVLFSMMFFQKINGQAKAEDEHNLKEIIEPSYPLAKELKAYSQVDYLHAQNVSKTAYQCALLIQADADVAAAAGFYYRLGKIEGEPFVANGVARAQANCLPESVVQILAEYNGEERLPSTKESAIVHMVDAVIAKFELLDKDTLSSAWNHNIVIYQTLDEKSSSGIYDESGLSMNQYLKIREYLVKGVTLL